MREYVALAAGVALCAFASAASATDLSVPAPINPDRFYVSFHGGYTFGNTSHDVAYDTDPLLPCCGYGPTYVIDSVSKPGWRIGGAVGTTLGDIFSIEAEVAYARADANIANVSQPIVASTTLTGSGSLLTGMINAYAGANMGPIRPYIGAGAGVGYFTAYMIQDPMNPSPAGPLLNGSDIGLAAQAMIGVDFAINANTSIGARYRYLYVTDLSLMDGTYKHDFNSTSQSAEIVLTQKFN